MKERKTQFTKQEILVLLEQAEIAFSSKPKALEYYNQSGFCYFFDYRRLMDYDDVIPFINTLDEFKGIFGFLFGSGYDQIVLWAEPQLGDKYERRDWCRRMIKKIKYYRNDYILTLP